MSLVTPAQSAAWFEAKGLVLGEQVDTCDECTHCEWPTAADELVILDGQDVCVTCLHALTGDDPYAPDHWRDL